MFEHGGGLHCRAFDGFGDEESLGFDDTGEYFCAEVFVHDAFVECVLVDDFQSRIAGDDEVAVVDLKARNSSVMISGEQLTVDSASSDSAESAVSSVAGSDDVELSW